MLLLHGVNLNPKPVLPKLFLSGRQLAKMKLRAVTFQLYFIPQSAFLKAQYVISAAKGFSIKTK